MKPMVYIAVPVPRKVEDYIGEYCNYRKWEGENPISREELLKEIKDAEGILLDSGTGGKSDEEFLAHGPKVKVISNVSVGYNNFDMDIMKKHNIIGTHTPYVLDDSVADLAVGLMISAGRRIAELNNYVKEGNWNNAIGKELFGEDIHHKTVGIIGMGRIGRVIAKRCKLGFDMDIVYTSRSRKVDIEEVYNAKFYSLEELLKVSDYVIIITPLTDKTYHLLDYEEFKMMKKSAIFINISRGQTVNEEGLIRALKEKLIKGAALDVFEKEPVDKNNPLLSMDNVVVVPHIGSATQTTRYNMAMTAAEDLVKAVTGKIPKFIVK
ncbi:D-glycerate dehydrogenase [uncultured Clostridium sp.]|uniref:2-hydroxyacid dehydrogenase n=1 Tax=uncultured Clostridium sp. TaxID=59620 RepID=UPI0028E1D10B|nr:D-glycerate dehydrogenase [uncultured Clostridium sp.]